MQVGTHEEAWGFGKKLEDIFLRGFLRLERPGVHMMGLCSWADYIPPVSLLSWAPYDHWPVRSEACSWAGAGLNSELSLVPGAGQSLCPGWMLRLGQHRASV